MHSRRLWRLKGLKFSNYPGIQEAFVIEKTNLDTQHCENQYFITSQLPLNWNPQEIIERILLHWDTETGTFGTKDNIFFEDRVRYKSIDGTKAHVALLNFTCNAFWAPAFDSYWQNQPMSSRIQFFKDHPEYNPLQIKKIPAASRRGILDAFEKSLAKPNSIFAPRGGVLDPKLHNKRRFPVRFPRVTPH